MNSAAQNQQALAQALTRGWADVTVAWLTAVTRVWETVVDWAYDEKSLTGANQALVAIGPQAIAGLRPEARPMTANSAPVPSASVSMAPATSPFGGPAVLITVHGSAQVPPGGYIARILDPAGAVVADCIPIVVAATS